VKLLFDENLAPALVDMLHGLFPGSEHVRNVGLKSSADRNVWAYASEMGYAIVTKDADFRQRSFLFGPPPKVIWIGLGNCSTKKIEELLRRKSDDIIAFCSADEAAFLVLR
jgi:predicted nuclease of predicted toxin-antitoxin system